MEKKKLTKTDMQNDFFFEDSIEIIGNFTIIKIENFFELRPPFLSLFRKPFSLLK